MENEEWDERCPECGSECEWVTERSCEQETWMCRDTQCGASIDVPIRIVRFAGVTVIKSG